MFNKKFPPQTFLIPDFSDHSETQHISLKSVKDLYLYERDKLIKLAPKLSQKVLFPSSFERQNVQHIVSLFNDKTISALKTFDASSFTANFLNTILRWWNIVDVKSLFKGKIERLPDSCPIQKNCHDSLKYVEEFTD